MNELNRWRIDGEGRDLDRMAEDQRLELDADAKLFGFKKRRSGKGGVVGDGDILRHQAAREERKADVAERDFASERTGELILNLGAERIGIDEERNQDQQDDDKGRSCDHRSHPALLHQRVHLHQIFLLAKGAGWNCNLHRVSVAPAQMPVFAKIIAIVPDDRAWTFTESIGERAVMR